MTKRIRLIILLVVPCAVLMLFLIKERLLGIASSLPPCSFRVVTGYHCPGCGNTRSVKALLHGDILLSLRNNPIILFGCLMGILFYLEQLAGFFGKEIKLVPRKKFVWGTIAAVFVIFYVVRNFIPEIAPVPAIYHFPLI